MNIKIKDLAQVPMVKIAKQTLVFFLSLWLLSVHAQAEIFEQEQDSIFGQLVLKNGQAQLNNLNLFPETTSIENLYLEVKLNKIQATKVFVQNAIRIEVEQEVDGIKERIEIARFFLPWMKDNTGTNLNYVFDISVYSPLFQEETKMYLSSNNKLLHQELDLHFMWKLGEPPAKVNQIIKLWNSSIDGIAYTPNISINQSFKSKSIRISEDIKYGLLKIYLSGRSNLNQKLEESDGSKFYFLNINKQSLAKRPIWRDDCSLNAIYPQEGPWTYSRPNWCPGQALRVYDHFFVLGKDSTLNIEFQIQEASKKQPLIKDFMLSANLILFEKAYANTDAAIIEILAPNKSIEHNRYNPICSSPVIRVRNTGSDTLRSLLIEYGLDNKKDNRYRWRGELAFMEEEIVYLPPLNWYFNSQINDSSEFCIEVEEVNKTVDENTGNNQLSTLLHLAPVFNNKISVQFYSPQAAEDNIIELVDDMGVPLFEAFDFVSDSTYTFDLDLPSGCYEFIVYDQKGDGVYFPKQKHGSIKIIDRITKAELSNFEPNFGAEIRQQFMILK